jgi:hypothetical protein
MNRRSLAVLFVAVMAVMGGACEDPVTQTPPALNLERPIDMSFACFGPMRFNSEPGTPIEATAQPTSACERLSPQVTPVTAVPPLEGQAELNPPAWYGFILQSAAGTVAMARWPAEPADAVTPSEFTVLDADSLTPGKNAISVGEEPIAIGTDASGCFQVTVNAGSCDMSILEVNSAVDGDPATPIEVKRREIKGGANGTAILARPAAMVVAPGSTVVGNRCPMEPTGVAYVAYPSCHLVAAVDLATGQIVSGIQFDTAGVATVVAGSAVSCRSECGGVKPLDPAATPGPRPVALDLTADVLDVGPATTRRLAIGADNQATITVVDLDAGFLPAATPPLQVALEDRAGKLGVSTVALSPRIKMGGSLSGPRFELVEDGLAGTGQYVYAVATDDTVRVADVLEARRECETQADSRFIRSRTRAELQCIQIGDTTAPRRAGARSPGIELPANGVPTSVAIIKGLDGPLLEPPDPNDPNAERDPIPPGSETLIGYFALITSSRGAPHVVNIDNDNEKDAPETFQGGDAIGTVPTLVMAHQLRDSFTARGLDPPSGAMVGCNVANPEVNVNRGGPRGSVPANNSRTGLAGVISPEKSLALPILRQVPCALPEAMEVGAPVTDVQYAAPKDIREQVFPDLGAVRPEQWTLTWEGPLSRDSVTSSVDGPIIRSAQMSVQSSGMFLRDASKPFCEMGVEPYDYVQFRGCDPTANECPAGYECFVHPESELARGACILRSEAQRLSNACRDFLTSLRHYTIGRASSGEMVLMPRKRVLRTTPVQGCLDEPPSADGLTTPQCEQLADYAARLASSSNPLTDTTPPDPRTWRCMADDTRRPVPTDPPTDPPTPKRYCVQTCTSNASCDANTICQGGVCMEGVVPPQACVNGPIRYEVHAGDAFTLLGSRSGFVHPIVADATDGGRCIRDPNAHALQRGRMPLTAEACTTSPADPFTDLLPNPCSLTVEHTERQPNYLDIATCRLPTPEEQQGDNPEPLTKIATRQAPAILLRTRAVNFTMVDPTYPGDQRCLLDGFRPERGLDLQGIPMVFPNYSFGFNQGGAYTPLEIPIDPTYPVKVLRGPGNSIWVVDEGDFLATQFGQQSTAGGVFRVDPVSLVTFVLLR